MAEPSVPSRCRDARSSARRPHLTVKVPVGPAATGLLSGARARPAAADASSAWLQLRAGFGRGRAGGRGPAGVVVHAATRRRPSPRARAREPRADRRRRVEAGQADGLARVARAVAFAAEALRPHRVGGAARLALPGRDLPDARSSAPPRVGRVRGCAVPRPRAEPTPDAARRPRGRLVGGAPTDGRALARRTGWRRTAGGAAGFGLAPGLG